MSHLVAADLLAGTKYSLLLSEEETLFLSSPETTGYGTWSPTNASLVPEETFRFRQAYTVLRVQPLVAGNGTGGSTEFSIEHEPKIVSQSLVGDKLALHVFVYPQTEMQVSLTLEDSNSVVAQSEYVTIPPQTWTLIKSAELAVTEQTQILRCTSSIHFRSNSSLNHLHVAHPILTNVYGFTENLFLRECLAFTPRFLIETDEAQENPKFPMFRFMDLGTAYADRAYRQIEDFRYRDISMGYDANDSSTWSKLVNVEVAEPDYLPWLGQFVGVTRKGARAGATPWGNLPTTWLEMHTSIDPDPELTFSISSIDSSGATLTATPTGLSIDDTVSISGTTNFNGQFRVSFISGSDITLDPAISAPAESTGTVTVVDSSWQEIESFDTQDSNFVAAQRTLIRTARTGHNAGTKQAIVDTLDEFLLGEQQYVYLVDHINEPWTIRIRTLTSETPSGVNGQPSIVLLDQLEPVRPMGFQIIHTCVDAFEEGEVVGRAFLP